jgi:hypothetical protein
LPEFCKDPYTVPPTGPVTLTFKGLPLDELEDLIPTSLASRQAARILAPEPTVIGGRPLTPLHAGQVGLIRGIADFSCKPFEKRLFFRWRHSIAKMFYRMHSLLALFAPAQ